MASRLQEICQKNGWKFAWMKDERARLEKDSRQRLSVEAWRERLQALAEKSTPDAETTVPEGFCVKGCGRKIASGLTKSGKNFTTCCRGCAMGLGHDQRCWGRVEKQMGAGLCKNGCGRKINPGRSLSGRPYDTCCRGCSRGVHDPSCAQDSSPEPKSIA